MREFFPPFENQFDIRKFRFYTFDTKGASGRVLPYFSSLLAFWLRLNLFVTVDLRYALLIEPSCFWKFLNSHYILYLLSEIIDSLEASSRSIAFSFSFRRFFGNFPREGYGGLGPS